MKKFFGVRYIISKNEKRQFRFIYNNTYYAPIIIEQRGRVYVWNTLFAFWDLRKLCIFFYSNVDIAYIVIWKLRRCVIVVESETTRIRKQRGIQRTRYTLQVFLRFFHTSHTIFTWKCVTYFKKLKHQKSNFENGRTKEKWTSQKGNY